MLSRAKRKPFVYTNSDETHARRCLDVLGLSRHFADVFFVDPSKDGYICKPDVAAFEEVEAAIRAAGPGLCPAGATLVLIDDSISNCNGAVAAGWEAVLCME